MVRLSRRVQQFAVEAGSALVAVIDHARWLHTSPAREILVELVRWPSFSLAATCSWAPGRGFTLWHPCRNRIIPSDSRQRHISRIIRSQCILGRCEFGCRYCTSEHGNYSDQPAAVRGGGTSVSSAARRGTVDSLSRPGWCGGRPDLPGQVSHGSLRGSARTLNALWSVIFFGWQNPGAAVVEVVIL